MSGLKLLQMTIILKVRTEKTFWTLKQHCLLSHECFKLALVSARHCYETTAVHQNPLLSARFLDVKQHYYESVPKGAQRGPSIFLVVNASSGLSFL